MQIHGRGKLGPAGHLALCQAIEGGSSFGQAAARLNVSPATPIGGGVNMQSHREQSDTHWRGRSLEQVALTESSVAGGRRASSHFVRPLQHQT
jgi:hypothetical protein